MPMVHGSASSPFSPFTLQFHIFQNTLGNIDVKCLTLYIFKVSYKSNVIVKIGALTIFAKKTLKIAHGGHRDPTFSQLSVVNIFFSTYPYVSYV